MTVHTHTAAVMKRVDGIALQACNGSNIISIKSSHGVVSSGLLEGLALFLRTRLQAEEGRNGLSTEYSVAGSAGQTYSHLNHPDFEAVDDFERMR